MASSKADVAAAARLGKGLLWVIRDPLRPVWRGQMWENPGGSPWGLIVTGQITTQSALC